MTLARCFIVRNFPYQTVIDDHQLTKGDDVVNFCAMTCPEEAADTPLEEYEREALERSDKFVKFGTAYVMEHATRTATIGFVLSSSPLALLAWYFHPLHVDRLITD